MTAVFDDLQFHFTACPHPSDAGCEECHAYERARRVRCHGTTALCVYACKKGSS